jgi:hypothetical protein
MKTARISRLKWVVLSLVFVGLGWFFFRWLPFNISPVFLSGTLWPAFILTLLNNHHFLIDGRIWKLKDPENNDLFTSSPVLQSQAG